MKNIKRPLLLLPLFCWLLAGCASDGGPTATGPRTVSWDEAVEILTSRPAEVESVFQTHNLEVTLIMRDGSGIQTVEPRIDLIFEVLEECGDPCAHILVATE